MSLNELLAKLEKKQPDAPLVFETTNGDIGGGYHVTELKSAEIQSIDCAGGLSTWTETALQLLDGGTGTHMKVGKFVKILKHSLDQIPSLSDAPLHAEFSPRNDGLSHYSITLAETGPAQAILRLGSTSAICKPAQNTTCGPACGPTAPETRACC